MDQIKTSSASASKSHTPSHSGPQTSGHSDSGQHSPKKGEITEEVRDTAKVLHGDLTKLSGPKADKAIGQWQSMLENLDVSGTKAVSTELGKLRELVSAAKPDGKAISRTLSSLGTKVRKIADESGGIVGTALNTLASGLEQGAQSLTPGEGKAKKAASH